MNKKNLIQFAQSLIILPIMTGVTPLANVSMINYSKETIQTVFSQKFNTESNSLSSINEITDRKTQALKEKAEAIDNYFKEHDMPLEGMGMKMVIEAEKNDLDWRLLAAISVRESTGGKNDCIKADNNPFGWGSCKISFKSYGNAIETVAKNLGGNNPKTSKHYEDKNTKEILQAYNPPSVVPKYAEQVMSIMKAIGDEDPGSIENS